MGTQGTILLDTQDPSKLAEEVRRAEDFRRKHTTRGREIARRFAGNWFRSDQAVEPTPENLVASYLAFMLPELAYSEPAVRIKAKRPIAYKQLADFLEMGLDGWIDDFGFGEEHQDVVRDFLINYGVMKVGMEPRDCAGDGATYQVAKDTRLSGGLRPFAVRVPPDQLILDPRCETIRQARFIGHVYWKDIDELQSDPERWDPAAVERLTASASDGSEDGYAQQQERALPFGTSGPRNRVKLVDLWIPETNELVTLAADANETLDYVLRRTQYHGPITGPYEIFGAYRIPGDPYPISPLQFVMEQFEEMQAHITAASDGAASYKRFVMVDAAARDTQDSILSAKNGEVTAIRGFNTGQFQQIELGGAHPEQMSYIQMLRDRFDRIIGMGDAQRGRATGKTATESQIVQSNTDSRTSYLKSRVTHSTKLILEKVLWYLCYDPNVVMPVSRTDPFTGQTSEGMFLGGVQEGQESIDFANQFSVEIVAESMSLTNDQVAQGRALQLFQLAPQAMQMAATMPGINTRWLVNQIGEAMNVRDLADILFNQQVMGQAGMLAQQQQAFGGMGAPQPLPQNVNPSIINAGLGMARPGQMPPTASPPQMAQQAMPGGMPGQMPQATPMAQPLPQQMNPNVGAPLNQNFTGRPARQNPNP